LGGSTEIIDKRNVNYISFGEARSACRRRAGREQGAVSRRKRPWSPRRRPGILQVARDRCAKDCVSPGGMSAGLPAPSPLDATNDRFMMWAAFHRVVRCGARGCYLQRIDLTSDVGRRSPSWMKLEDQFRRFRSARFSRETGRPLTPTTLGDARFRYSRNALRASDHSAGCHAGVPQRPPLPALCVRLRCGTIC